MRFDLDEPLFPIDHAHQGLLTAAAIRDLEEEWKVAKVDEWCAVSRLGSAAGDLRAAVNAPAGTEIGKVLAAAGLDHYARQGRVQRALTAYEEAATQYEAARVQLADIRRRAFVAPAA